MASQDVSYTLAIRDNIRGKLFAFTVAGNVPVEGSYNFDYNGTDASLAEHWQFLSAGYTWHDDYSANLYFGATVQDVETWYNNNQLPFQLVQVVLAKETPIPC